MLHSIKSFKQNTADEFANLQQQNDIMFSENAVHNPDEFYAESVELYFERATEFRNHHPEVYFATERLLNQRVTV